MVFKIEDTQGKTHKTNRHKSWKGNFTWRDMAWLLLGWIIGVTWMLVWLLVLGRGVI